MVWEPKKFTCFKATNFSIAAATTRRQSGQNWPKMHPFGLQISKISPSTPIHGGYAAILVSPIWKLVPLIQNINKNPDCLKQTQQKEKLILLFPWLKTLLPTSTTVINHKMLLNKITSVMICFSAWYDLSYINLHITSAPLMRLHGVNGNKIQLQEEKLSMGCSLKH